MWAPERIESPTTSTSSCSRDLGDHLGRLVEARVDDLHTVIAQHARDGLRAAVVTVETGFADQHSYLAFAIAPSFSGGTGDGSEDLGFLVLSELVAQHLGDLAEGAVRVRSGDEALEQIPALVAGLADGVQLASGRDRLSSRGAQVLQALALLDLH